MGPEFQEGLHIVVVGIGGVFGILLVVMGVVVLLGRVFGKKPAPKKAVTTRKSRKESGPDGAGEVVDGN